MSSDEYLSSPIKQSQRCWCEGDVILMRSKGPAPSEAQTRAQLSGASLLSTHLGPGCGQIFVLSSVSRPIMINGHSAPWLIIQSEKNDKMVSLKQRENLMSNYNQIIFRVFLLFVFRYISWILFQTLNCLWLWDLFVCNGFGLCSGNREILRNSKTLET